MPRLREAQREMTMTDTKPKKLSPDDQSNLYDRLIDAAKDGNTETVKMLLASGANVRAWDDYALSRAARNGHTETVKTLLAAGANVHANDDVALCWAALNGHAETVQSLLGAGADVHAQDDWALCLAASFGHTETVRILARHIFAPDSWCGKNRAEIEAVARALYNKIEADGPNTPEHLHQAATILADAAIDYWHQVRPAPPKLQISPLPAQPTPL
jgi:ankyrin repeat protein